MGKYISRMHTCTHT